MKKAIEVASQDNRVVSQPIIYTRSYEQENISNIQKKQIKEDSKAIYTTQESLKKETSQILTRLGVWRLAVYITKKIIKLLKQSNNQVSEIKSIIQKNGRSKSDMCFGEGTFTKPKTQIKANIERHGMYMKDFRYRKNNLSLQTPVNIERIDLKNNYILIATLNICSVLKKRVDLLELLLYKKPTVILLQETPWIKNFPQERVL
ncbi:hypothetical protein THOM_2831 [Trachipleistophora hominis]|uniref:Uncharacterized protein n=1 Tax=Trachipleistophora hominis TaxID=72359 RepID=L7JS64_TRAHO|nr:hypothetical protein THOM_2831 [Trachipleistophora hominis]